MQRSAPVGVFVDPGHRDVVATAAMCVGRTEAAPEILAPRHRLKVRGVHAASNPAQMVQI
jgi:hypothetical protein